MPFKFVYRIAKCKKPHTNWEKLVLPPALDLASTLIGESVAQKLKSCSDLKVFKQYHLLEDG